MTIDDLSARLERVERQNRRMRAGGIAAVVFLAAGVAMGQAAPVQKEVRTERLEIVDGSGIVRARCFVTSDGAVGLGLSDKNGKPRGVFGVNTDGFPHVSFVDAEGRPSAAFHTAADGTAGLGFTADGEKGGLLVGSDSDGSRHLMFMGSGKKLQIALSVTADGKPSLVMWDRDEREIFRAPAK